MSVHVAELARRINATVAWLGETGANGPILEDIALPRDATKSSLSFLINSCVARELNDAGAVLVEADLAHLVARPLVVDRIKPAIARAHQWLPVKNRENRPAVTVAADIHPTACLDSGVTLGWNTVVGANSVLTGDVRIGDFCSVGPNVTVIGPVSIGNRVHIDANSTIGSQPFTYVSDGHKWSKWPAFCGVKIRDGVEIGAGVTIDRGVTHDTTIGDDVKLDNQVHVGHGAAIGRDCVIAARTTIAGEVVIGKGCKIGGACSMSEGISLADGVTLMGQTAVTRSLTSAGEYTSVWPAQARNEWWRQIANLKQLAKRQCRDTPT
ncbi:MAG: UDP-3-O-(3-hydroxymyristoyl)glucosamine N-acyltransferase [Gammaproteobacteria bacterium]